MLKDVRPVKASRPCRSHEASSDILLCCRQQQKRKNGLWRWPERIQRHNELFEGKSSFLRSPPSTLVDLTKATSRCLHSISVPNLKWTICQSIFDFEGISLCFSLEWLPTSKHICPTWVDVPLYVCCISCTSALAMSKMKWKQSRFDPISNNVEELLRRMLKTNVH